MKSNFEFLNQYWPLLAQLGANAENYVHSDPNACIYKLGLFSERLVQEILVFEKIKEPEYDNTHSSRIQLLKRKHLLPRAVDDILFLLRKKRNLAVHTGVNLEKEAGTLLSLTFNLSVWFMKTYGDRQFKYSPFVMPEECPMKALETLIAEQEAKIAMLSQQLEEITTVASALSREERVAQSDYVLEKLTWNETQIRLLIDSQLRKAGWEADSLELRYSKGVRPARGRKMVISEWPVLLESGNTGYVDYAFFIGEELVAFLEAKKMTETVCATIDVQVKDYASHVRSEDVTAYAKYACGKYKVPFLFASNGRPYLEQIHTESGIWFWDARTPNQPSYPLRNWFSPEDLEGKLKQNISRANQQLSQADDSFMRDRNGLNLRKYQIEAIQAVTKAVLDGKKRALIAMATGTGKTRMILGLIYKMLVAERFRRILFLVDRVALGKQAVDAFKDVKLKELLSLDQIYDVRAEGELNFDTSTRVCVSTVQGLLHRTILSSKPDLTPGAFDLIIVDEAHRGYVLDKNMSPDELLYEDQNDYLSKYKQVIDYFDAVKVGLTATPALHTTQIFGNPVYTYSYRSAVVDGYLVDYEPPYQISTEFMEKKLEYKKGEQLQEYDPKTNQVVEGQFLEDNVDFDIGEFNRKIVIPSTTRKVLEEVARYLDPTGRQKTLIFAVNDQHADQIVDILRDIYKAQGVSDEAILKITGKTASGNKERIAEVINRFKNNQYPNIAVTVELLTTGIDVPSICNLVFMRKVNSRILFEQMLGRATRLCPSVGKTHFRVFDVAKVFDDLKMTTTMRAVAVHKPMEELLKTLTQPAMDINKEPIREQIRAKLQAKKNILSETQKTEISEVLGKDFEEYVEELKHMPMEEFVRECQEKKELFIQIGELKPPKHGFYYSDKEDTLLETKRLYGEEVRPEDYLERFAEFVRENQDRIVALQLVCTRPNDITRAQMKELVRELESKSFNILHLNAASKKVRNEDIVAHIISHIRHVLSGTPIYDHQKRVTAAFERLCSMYTFTETQMRFLDHIQKYMMDPGNVLNTDTFNAEQFKYNGGFDRYNKRFDGNLLEIIQEINHYIYEGTA
ncbi:MAG: type I restriction-modification system endonuclease [Planctomycetia bacterium]|nr:type I restriction-modification system endonuclease [Planctomycetia bacterium]